jgi:hypothetical protein
MKIIENEKYKEVAMKKYFCVCILVFFCLIMHGKDLKEVISQLQKSVIPIKYSISMPTMGGGEVDIDYIQPAIVINSDLVVITDGGVLTGQSFGGGMFGRFASGRRQKPKSAKVFVGKDVEIPAQFLGINSEYNLAYFKLLPSPDQKVDLVPLPCIDDEKISVQVGDEIYTLKLVERGRQYGFPFEISKYFISYQFPTSQKEFAMPIDRLFEIIVDKDFNILGFTYTFSQSKRRAQLTTSEEGRVRIEETREFGLLYTKSKLEILIKEIPKEGEEEKKRGWFGLAFEKISPELKDELKLSDEQAGLRVSDVLKGTPADQAGLKVDDIIIEIGEKKTVFKNPQEEVEFYEWLKKIEVDKGYTVKFLRKEGGSFVQKELTITTIEKPKSFEEIEDTEFKFLGIKVKPITYDYKYSNRIPTELKGLVVTFAKSGEPFNIVGILPSDIILAIGKEQKELKYIESIEDLKSALKELKKEKPSEIMVKIYCGRSPRRLHEGTAKEVKIYTVRISAKNYEELEKDLKE